MLVTELPESILRNTVWSSIRFRPARFPQHYGLQLHRQEPFGSRNTPPIKLAALDPSTPIPFAITSDQYSAHVQGGSYASVRLTFSGVGQGLRLIATSTSSPPDALTASFGENPVTINPANNPRPIVAVDLQAGQSAVSGQYVMAVGASNDQVSVSTLLSVYVTAQPASVGWGIYPVTAIIILVSVFRLDNTSEKGN